MDVVSSSTNIIKHMNGSNTSGTSSSSSSNNAAAKQELAHLADNFDKKFNELLEIRDQLKKIINEIS
jgi:hypothetical protein